MMNVIIFGPPGSGKGTQSNFITEKYNLKHVSTGDLLRAEIANNSPLGLEAKTYMDKGQLVPDAVVIGMINNVIDNNPAAQGFLFDGFPRTTAQAQSLDALLAQKNSTIDVVVALQVSEAELLKRLVQRGATSNRKDDSDEQIIQDRITEYKNKTAPLITYFSQQQKFIPINGEGSIDDIFSRIQVALTK